MTEQTVSIIEKNKKEDFHIRLVELYGKPYVDVRTFVRHWGQEHRAHPTKKGFTVALNQLDAIINALQEARGIAFQEGLFENSESTPAVDFDAGDIEPELNILGAG
jgi:hypothetical protein